MGSRTVTCNGTSGGKYNLTINYWCNWQDTAANVSNIYVEALLQRNDGYAGSYYNLIENQNSAYIDVGGTRRVSRNLKIDTRNSAVVTLASWSGNVSHNADGTLTLSIGAGFSTPVSSLTGGSVTDSWTLTTIPRKSDFTLSAGTVEAGKPITVTISPANNSFTHKVTYAFGSNSSTASLSAGNKTSTKTIPLSWLTAIPDNTSGTASVTVETLSGGTPLGAITRYFTVVCPADVKPTISSVTVTRIDNNVPPSWGIYVKGESQARVSVTASGIYGSTIKSYQISGAGFSGTSSALTTGALNTAGTYTFTARVTDSRPGRTDTAVSDAITVYDYAPPTLSIGDVFRCNADGARNDGGNYLSVTAGITVNTLGGRNAGTLSYSIVRAGQSPGSYTAMTPGAAVIIPNVSSNYSYTLYLKVTDQIHSPTPTTIDIATAEAALNFAVGGKGIGIGKVSERDGLEVAWPTYFNGDVTIGTITGLLKSTAGKVEAATVGTDYATADMGIKTLTGTVDFNSIDTPGIYKIRATTFAHGPDTALFPASGTHTLTVEIGAAPPVRQRLTNGAWTTVRSGGNGVFTSWEAYMPVPNSVIDGSLLKRNANTIVSATAGTDYEKVTMGGTATNRYARFASGFQVCWGSRTMSITSSYAFGAIYYGTNSSYPITFPVSFSETPAMTVSIGENDFISVTIMDRASLTNSGYSGRWCVYSPDVRTETMAVTYIATGRWK